MIRSESNAGSNLDLVKLKRLNYHSQGNYEKQVQFYYYLIFSRQIVNTIRVLQSKLPQFDVQT